MTTPPTDPSPAQATEVETTMAQPIVVDLGRKKASKIRDLKDGEGELWDDVLDVIDEVKEMLGKEADGKVLVPTVVLVEKMTRRQRIERILFPLANWDDDDDDDDDDE